MIDSKLQRHAPISFHIHRQGKAVAVHDFRLPISLQAILSTDNIVVLLAKSIECKKESASLDL